MHESNGELLLNHRTVPASAIVPWSPRFVSRSLRSAFSI